MPKTLLLADDSVTIQKVVAISFASEDIVITTVDNGDDAVTRARELRPDVILADVVMPGKNGYEVCEAIQADAALRHIPVLLLTGTFEAFDEDRARRAGAAGHLAKPFEAQALVERVRGLLQRAAAPAAEASALPPAPTTSPTNAADDDFDFFDDEGDAEAEAAGADLDLSPADSGFSFGDDDLTDDAAEVLPAPDLRSVQPAAQTVAILPDPPGPSRPGAGETVLALPEEPTAEDEGLDFEFESLTSTPRETQVEGLSEEAVLDPQADSGFVDPDDDVPAGLEAPDATQLLDSSFPTNSDEDDDDAYDAEEDDEISSPESLAPEFDAWEQEDHDLPISDPLRETAALEAEPLVPRSRSHTPTWEQAADDDFALAEPEPLAASPEPEPLVATPQPLAATPEPLVTPPESPPLPARETPSAPSLAAPSALAEAASEPTEALLERVSPELRAQLHETLERVAWEAFGQMTEKIVEQAVERVEKAAWEVVPRLAETLIREEIRKLKGE